MARQQQPRACPVEAMGWGIPSVAAVAPGPAKIWACLTYVPLGLAPSLHTSQSARKPKNPPWDCGPGPASPWPRDLDSSLGLWHFHL